MTIRSIPPVPHAPAFDGFSGSAHEGAGAAPAAPLIAGLPIRGPSAGRGDLPNSGYTEITAAMRRIVVVDDDARFRESLCELLLGHGYPAPKACASGRELMQILAEAEHDLVLLDLRLGDASGLDILAMLRQGRHDIAVVVVSGDTMIESAIGALRLGANDYVRKPYAPEMLLHTVESVLRRRDLERANRAMSQRLERSERMHRFLVDTSPDLICTLDLDYNFVFASERVAQLACCSAEELAGQSFLSIVYEEDLERARYTLGRVGHGECNTELRLISRSERKYRHFDLQLIPVDLSQVHFGNGGTRRRGYYLVARDISERKQADDHLAYLAYHDVLTGLPNRALFRDRVGLAMVQAKRNGMKLATMFIDLDRFKLANDTFGHQQGDELLKEAARRLQEGLREADTLARIGGDEFTILLPGLKAREDAARVADKLVADMARPYRVGDSEVYLTASVGVSIYPDDGDDIETLLRHADIAMYHVKATGKNAYGFFQRHLGEDSKHRLSIESEVRHGHDGKQFELHYQPQFDAGLRKVVGLEALVRWQHPSRGLVSAGNFVPIVEEIGLMPAFTFWVLDTACRDLRSWWDKGYDLERLSVNISPCVLESDHFHERLIDTLRLHGIPPERFEVEITENTFIGDRQNITDHLMAISRSGVRIAIDDFGTRYSSLAYLRNLPVNTLKIDQSFIHEIERVDDSSPIVRAIVAIAAGLELNVVAEGVETEVQSAFLQSLGCREMQGYLYGRPMSASAIDTLLGLNDLPDGALRLPPVGTGTTGLPLQ